MPPYSGAFARAYRVETAAPLGRAAPYTHADAVQPITRDDAPPTSQIPTPTPFLTREDWLKDNAGPLTPDSVVRRSHSADGSHLDGDNDAHVESAPWLTDNSRQEYGGHTDALNQGSRGATHAGLRSDNSSDWANPGGFDLGHDYTNRQSNRRMGSYRMRGAYRPIQDPYVESGENPSPPTGLGRFTSMFDPTAAVRTWGVSMPTTRRVMRPNGDDVSTDSGPNFDAVTYGIGGGFAL